MEIAMRTQSQDTDIRTEAVLASLLRNLPFAKKFAQVRSLTETSISLSRRAIRRTHEGIDEDRLSRLFVELHYGKELAGRFQDYIEKKVR
jgi:hypothetical protein